LSDIHLICCAWGDITAKQLDGDNAWDRNNIIAGIFEGGGDGRPGHRRLCQEMNPDEQRVQSGYLQLSRGLQKAFGMRYVIPTLIPHSDGHFWTNREMARTLSLSKDAFLQRVKRARTSIKRSQF